LQILRLASSGLAAIVVDRKEGALINERLERIAALALIRDHIVANETYLLDKGDLQFAGLLPPPPEPSGPFAWRGGERELIRSVSRTTSDYVFDV
jgi:hypothetical protein